MAVDRVAHRRARRARRRRSARRRSRALEQQLRRRRRGVGHESDHAARAADARLGLRAREQAALAVGADDDDGLTRRAETPDLRGRARDVEHRERDALVDVARAAAPTARSRRESPCRAPRRARSRRRSRRTASMCSGVSVSETSDAMRSPDAQIDSSRSASPISSTRPTNIPPLPVTGLCCLPRSRTISQDVLADSRGIEVAARRRSAGTKPSRC